MKTKLKDLLNENMGLGEMPSDKLFKYNKETGKFESPEKRKMQETIINEGATDGIRKEIEKLISAIAKKDTNLIDKRALDAHTPGEILGMFLLPILQGARMDTDKGFSKYLKGKI